MKRVLFSLLIALCVLAVPALASADDIMPPAWRGLPGTTYTEWSSWMFDDASGFFAPDVATQSPLEPYVGPSVIAPGPWAPTPDGILFLSPFSILLSNFETPNPVKEIRLQVTYLNIDSAPNVLGVYGSDPQMDWQISWFDYVSHGENWYTDVYDLTLWPNPSYEVIDVGNQFGPVLVSQVVVDTWCVGGPAVPVPAAIWLLGSGLIGLLGLRRKFRG